MKDNADRKSRSRLDIEVTRQALIAAPIDEVFNFEAAEDVLPKILTGYGLVPGVASTSDISGPWDRAGSHRIVHLADGSTLNEGVTEYAPLLTLHTASAIQASRCGI
jgi:hypothetical protein